MRSPWLAAVAVSSLLLPSAATASGEGPTSQDRRQVADIAFIGEVVFPTGLMLQGTEIGGLSGITFDPELGVYYALSDDRTGARFYTLAIDLGDGRLDDGDIVFQDVTTLIDQGGQGFPDLGIDPEGIVLSSDRTLFVSSEGDASMSPPLDPFVREFGIDGQPIGDPFPVPAKFLPRADGVVGIRTNLAFESLTLTPNGQTLTTATENALAQDGPAADVEQPSLLRILDFDLASRAAGREVVFEVGPVPFPPVPADAFRTNGLVELLATDNNGTLLALERAFSVGVGNTVQLFEVLSQGALDVSGVEDLVDEENGIPFEIDPAVQKRLLVDFADLPLSTIDNLEGLAFGPLLPDGRQSLIVVSDNNFGDTQVTQFVAFAVEFATTPAVRPSDETPQANDAADATSPLQGDSDDPAIYVHPTTPARSLVLATQKDGGLVVFDLGGNVRQVILPAPFGEIRYNNVDVVYGFELDGRPVDLAVASDRANDTLAIFRIDDRALQLENVTSVDIPETIFGIDDGEATAYGLATYKSPISGRQFVFVTQRDGAQVAQLELLDDGAGGVDAETVRILDLPVPTGDPEESQSEGIVVDRELGLLYVGLEEVVGVVRFDAEPDGSSDFAVVIPIDQPFIQPDIEGLTIYYGANGDGAMLVSSQGDSSFAVFDRGDGTEDALTFLGSLVIGDKDEIDQTNESDGADVTNVALGERFPRGLLVVQDGASEPQSVVQDEEELENNATNFKFIPWERVARAFDPRLPIDIRSFDPRDN